MLSFSAKQRRKHKKAQVKTERSSFEAALAAGLGRGLPRAPTDQNRR